MSRYLTFQGRQVTRIGASRCLGNNQGQNVTPNTGDSQQDCAVLDCHGGNLGFLAGAVHSSSSNCNGLRGNNLRHHTTGGVRCNQQGLADTNLMCGGSLQAGEEDVAVHHRAGHEHADPTDDRGQQAGRLRPQRQQPVRWR